MSEEDMFPVWFSTLCRDELNVKLFNFSSQNEDGSVTTRKPTQRINVRHPVVCRPCNTQWMSQIENAAKPTLEKLILQPDTPHTFTEHEHASIVLWTAIKAVILDHAAVRLYAYKPFFMPHQRQALKDQWSPPDNMFIWLSKLGPSPDSHGAVLSTYSQLGLINPIKDVYAYAFSLSAERLVIHAVSLINIKTRRPVTLDEIPDDVCVIRPRIGPWSNYLINLLPRQPSFWPPVRECGENNFEALAYRISGRPQR
jgi:hypothetical protein